jgi:DNA-binding CsgD family transcriptional regulator
MTAVEMKNPSCGGTLNVLPAILPVHNFQLDKLSDRPTSACNCNDHLYQAVLENLTDGILVLTETGQPAYFNSLAQKICAQMNVNIADFEIPKEIWQVCQLLTHERWTLPVQPTTLISEIERNKLRMLRIRVQWLKVQEEKSYFLVNLEDCQQANRDRAISETHQYGLSNREADVWLLRRIDHSYQAIAAQLYISIDTVKKHLRRIYAKQKAYLDRDK